MKVGTRSILFGYHAFWLHPFMVAAAWWKLYGFPFDPRLWAAFFLHDIGYIGKPNMDGAEGQTHPELGAAIMGRLFDPDDMLCYFAARGGELNKLPVDKWHDFSLYHSRDYARRHGATVSKLCIADKLAGCMYPNWLAIGLCKLSGELDEYMTKFKRKSPREWAEQYRVETLKWIKANYNYNEASPNHSDRRSEQRSHTDNGISSLRNS